MKTVSIFNLLSGIFRESGIRCVLIGGYAVNAHKVVRNTLDIDFLLTREDFTRISGRLQSEGYRITNEQESFLQLAGEEPALRDLDFMFVDRGTLDAIIAGGMPVSIAGEQWIVPSVLHLIALKLHSIKHNPHRELSDFPDIARLCMANGVDVEGDRFRAVCLKFGTPELLAKVIAAVAKEHNPRG